MNLNWNFIKIKIDMTKFTHNDIVTAIEGNSPELRPGQKAWIVSVRVNNERPDRFVEQYGDGAVHLIEFEDGEAVQAHELQLKLIEKCPDN